jgi:transcriptional regulator with XRE-family HTH domain
MINNSEFAERLKILMDYYQLSASAFADRIQVQRSSISHLLSGRNRPSLDFVLKVVKEFKEVELYWLLNGKGEFPDPALNSPASVNTSEKGILKEAPLATLQNTVSNTGAGKKIERIVLFFEDGTFKEYLK